MGGNWVCFFILAAPSDGAVYVCPPLICKPARFMRKTGDFRATDCCKWFWGRELRIFGEYDNSRIVQTESIRILGGEHCGEACRVEGMERR